MGLPTRENLPFDLFYGIKMVHYLMHTSLLYTINLLKLQLWRRSRKCWRRSKSIRRRCSASSRCSKWWLGFRKVKIPVSHHSSSHYSQHHFCMPFKYNFHVVFFFPKFFTPHFLLGSRAFSIWHVRSWASFSEVWALFRDFTLLTWHIEFACSSSIEFRLSHPFLYLLNFLYHLFVIWFHFTILHSSPSAPIVIF